MTQAVIGTNVFTISALGDNELYVTNLGPGEIYYSAEPSVTQANGLPLDVGNSVQSWPVGTNMYVVCPSGTATIAYANNGSSVAIGSTTATLAPGSTVSIEPGSVIPVQVQGDLNANIVGGVTIDSGTVDATISDAVVNLNSTATVVLGNMNLGMSGGTLATAVSLPASGVIDVSAYSSIIMEPIYSTSPTNLPTAVGNYAYIDVEFYDAANTVLLGSYHAEWLLNNGPQALGKLQVPVLGPSMSISLEAERTTATSATNFNLRCPTLGSHEVIPTPRYESNVPSSGYVGMPYPVTKGSVGQGSAFFSSKNGPATWSVYCGNSSSAGSSSLQVCIGGTAYIMASTGAIPAGSAQINQVNLPMAPIQIGYNLTAGTNLTSTLIQG